MKNIFKLCLILFIFSAFLPALFVFAQYDYNYNYYPACNYHAYRDCAGSAIYWYDSCAVRQDLIQDCASFGQTCQYGQCVVSNIQPYNDYVPYYRIGCLGNSLRWYDSLGVMSGLYKNCQDANSCTIDSCADSRCSNVLKCDGSTCAMGSAAFNSYCADNNPVVNPVVNPANNALSITFLAKKDVSATQWNKTIQLSSDGNAYFLATIVNNLNAQADDISVKTNIPTEVGYLGNLKINDISVSGDIVSGVSIGSLAAGTTKVITFEGKTQIISAEASKNATITATAGSATQTDSVTINFIPSQTQSAAAVSPAPAASDFWSFLKRWYLWILVMLVLIFLFVVVFRRLSSNT